MFSRIFIFITHSEISKILKDISHSLNCESLDGEYLGKVGYSISIAKNDDFNLKKAVSFPDGFLFFPFSIEMEIDDSINLNQVIIDTNVILENLWFKGYPQ